MISVIIPVHNGEDTLLTALQSVKDQSVEKELIVVDDFSTDQSFELAVRFARHCEFKVIVTTVSKERPTRIKSTGAPNVPRNIGVSLATGEYIAFLDQDDWWEDDKLVNQLAAIKSFDICTTSFLSHVEETGKTRLHGKSTGNWEPVENILESFLRRDKAKLTLMSTMLFKKSIYPQMDEYFGLTDFLWTTKLLEGHTAVVIEDPLTHRGVSGHNASYKKIIRKLSMYEQLLTTTFFSDLFRLDKVGRTVYGSYARYCYQQGLYKEARYYFFLAPKSVKVVLYYLTSFIPPLARYISRKFCVWGDN